MDAEIKARKEQLDKEFRELELSKLNTEKQKSAYLKFENHTKKGKATNRKNANQGEDVGSEANDQAAKMIIEKMNRAY
jgi:hypothetical protein